MSTTLNAVPRTIQQRSMEATRHLCEVLGLADLKLLATALAETAADEAKRNPDFAARIRQAYQDLEQAKKVTRRRSSPATFDAKLVPVAGAEDAKLNPYGPPDPLALLKLYGPAQLRAALERYSRNTLKETSANVEAQHPGTKPTSRARKDAIIDYIVEHVAGPGY